VFATKRKIISPSSQRTPQFDNGNENSEGGFGWACPNCRSHVEIKLRTVLDGYLFGNEHPLTEELLAFSVQEFGLDMYKPAPCGGWSYYIVRECSQCGCQFVLWVGMNEVRNSHYLLTVHAVYEFENQLESDTKLGEVESATQSRKRWWKIW
jgi:hypothetical protein